MEDRGREHPPICVEGAFVALGPPRRDLLTMYQRWHNDVATLRTYALPMPSTLEQDKALLTALTASREEVFFTIYERATWRPIGTTYLTGIDHQQRRAELGILIGDVARRGRGYGSEVTRLMRDYAFATLGLHGLMLTVYEYNLAERRAYEKAGFREVARQRQSHWLAGRNGT
jgi:RimJ/RimL family protein N-acetyltransferase